MNNQYGEWIECGRWCDIEANLGMRPSVNAGKYGVRLGKSYTIINERWHFRYLHCGAFNVANIAKPEFHSYIREWANELNAASLELICSGVSGQIKIKWDGKMIAIVLDVEKE